MQTLVSIYPWIQVILSVLIIVLVLLQKSEAGLGSSFGGSGGASSFHTKRGAERFLFMATITLGVLFAVVALGALVIARG